MKRLPFMAAACCLLVCAPSYAEGPPGEPGPEQPTQVPWKPVGMGMAVGGTLMIGGAVLLAHRAQVEARDDVEQSWRYHVAADVLLAAGAVSAVAGISIFLLAPSPVAKASTRLDVTASGVRVVGDF